MPASVGSTNAGGRLNAGGSRSINLSTSSPPGLHFAIVGFGSVSTTVGHAEE